MKPEGRITTIRKPRSGPQQGIEFQLNALFSSLLGTDDKLRTWNSFDTYRAKSWSKPRRIVARLEASLRPDVGGFRQEVDIRYIVTSLEGSAHHLYEEVYCQRRAGSTPSP